MIIAVRYQSRGGNTKVVAEAIAKATGVVAEPIEKPLDAHVDLLIVGGGVYAWGLDEALVSFLESLDPAKVNTAAAFTTAGAMNKTKDIDAIVKARGINVSKESLAVKFGPKYHATFGGAGKAVLSEKQTAVVGEFVKKVVG